MYSNILYILATGLLFIGSCLSFEKDVDADYFFLIGSFLFFVKAMIGLIKEIRRVKPVSGYTSI